MTKNDGKKILERLQGIQSAHKDIKENVNFNKIFYFPEFLRGFLY